MKIVLIAIITCLISFASFGQIVDYKLRELSQQEANKWSMKLELSENQTKKMAQALFDHDVQLRDINGNVEDYPTHLSRLEEKRNAELKQIMGNQKFKSYKLLYDLNRDDLYNSMQELVGSYGQNKEFVRELVELLRQQHLFLSKYYIEFTDGMNVKDFRVLDNAREYLFVLVDTALVDRASKERVVFKDNAYDQVEVLLKTINKYNDNYAMVMDKVAPRNKSFNEEMRNLFLSHYPDSNLETIAEMNKILSKGGFTSDLDKIHFILTEPYNEDRMLHGRIFTDFARRRLLEILK